MALLGSKSLRCDWSSCEFQSTADADADADANTDAKGAI